MLQDSWLRPSVELSVTALPHCRLITAAATHRRVSAPYRHVDALIGGNLAAFQTKGKVSL
jgi:hypothetical protein